MEVYVEHMHTLLHYSILKFQFRSGSINSQEDDHYF